MLIRAYEQKKKKEEEEEEEEGEEWWPVVMFHSKRFSSFRALMALTPRQNVLFQGNLQVGQIESYYFKLTITFFNLNSFLGIHFVNSINLSRFVGLKWIDHLQIN